MQNLNKYFTKIIFILGFFSALPFFFIPYAPFVHINIFYIDNIWNDILTKYPGYTSSLGMALPFIFFFLFIFFCFYIFSSKNKKENLKLIILGGSLVITNSLIIFFLTSSIKSLSLSFSLFGLFMILILNNNINFKIFCKGFLISLFFFIHLHVLSFFITGIEFSYSINGISIFGFEIYQSLVSYIYVVSFFLGTLILKKDLIINLIKFKNKKINFILYYITIFSCFIIIIISARRFAFLIFLLSCLTWFAIYLKNIKNKLSILTFSIIAAFFSVLFLINKFFFTGVRTFNYVHMIEPRLSVIVTSINEIFNIKEREFYYGKLNSWGNVESGIMNILYNAGVIGLISFLFTFIFLIYSIYSKLNVLILKNNRSYIFFSFFVLFFSNIVNNSISTPYFFISFFMILLFVLNEEREVRDN